MKRDEMEAEPYTSLDAVARAGALLDLALSAKSVDIACRSLVSEEFNLPYEIRDTSVAGTQEVLNVFGLPVGQAPRSHIGPEVAARPPVYVRLHPHEIKAITGDSNNRFLYDAPRARPTWKRRLPGPTGL